MRHSWRFLLLRSRYLRCNLLSHSPHFPSAQSAPDFSSVRHLSSFFANPQLTSFANPSIMTRNLTSEAAVELKDSDHAALLGDILSKFEDLSDVRREIELHNVALSHDLILTTLKGLDASPDVARKFFGFVSESHGERLSSKSFNLMLRILGLSGFDKEFWDLIEIMKGKGYGVSKYVRDKMLEKFEKEGRTGDIEKLKGIFVSGSIDKSPEKVCALISRIVKSEVWSEEVETKLRTLNFEFSNESVMTILENLAGEPSKAFIFFRWLEESGCIKHGKRTYNAMARVLGREDSVEKFWKILDEMRAAGYELESKTYAIVLKHFLDRKMVEEAVRLYEFAMGGSHKPSVRDCTFILKKIAVSKSFDIALFSRAVNAFYGNGNGSVLTDSMLSAVVKSLASVGRLGKCSKVLKVMKETGYVAGSDIQSKIAFELSRSGQKKQVNELIKTTGNNPGHQTWMSLIEGHCMAGDLGKASDCFRELVKKEEGTFVGNAFEYLVSSYCRKNGAADACKLMHECVSENHLKPGHSTYELLISKLLVQEELRDAMGLLSLMKSHGFPPFLDPFIEYISKSGTGEDAVAFSKAVTSKRFPSTSVYVRMFEAFFEARRRKEAQEFLSKCPKHIRDHADFLDLFCPKPKGGVAAVAS